MYSDEIQKAIQEADEKDKKIIEDIILLFLWVFVVAPLALLIIIELSKLIKF